MSKPPRDHASPGWSVYFVTASTWQHRSLFQGERLARLFTGTLFHYRREQRFLLHEFIVMPDHFHLLLTPTAISLERAMQLIKSGFSYRVRKELGLNVEIWERGYVDHRIRDTADYRRHADYIRQNPVVGGIAQKPEDYSYSSASIGCDLDGCPQRLKPDSFEMAQRHG